MKRRFYWKYVNLGNVGFTVAATKREAEKNIRYSSMQEFGRFEIKELKMIRELERKEKIKFN